MLLQYVALGPGSYHPAADNKYAYIDQTGDIRLEANMEYRFRIIQDLHGAVFMDAGNVWLLQDIGFWRRYNVCV